MQNEITKKNDEEIHAVKGELTKLIAVAGLSGVNVGSITVAMAEVFGSLLASAAKPGQLEAAIDDATKLARVTALETHARLVKFGLAR